MKITPQFLKAIDKAVKVYGSIYQLAKYLGIAHSTIIFWQTGKTSSLSDKLWNTKLKHKLQPFIDTDLYHTGDIRHARYLVSEQSAPYLLAEVPVTTFQAMTLFDPHIESASDFAKRNLISSSRFATETGEGFFALKLESQQLCSQLPIGTELLIDGGSRFVKNEDIVVAKLHNEPEIVFKRFIRNDEFVELRHIGPGGKSYSWSREENTLAYIDWLFPVIEINMNLQESIWNENNELVPKPKY